jgi:hypothetical protein
LGLRLGQMHCCGNVPHARSRPRRVYNARVARNVLIFGLILLAAFLPLAVLPVAITVAATLVFVAAVTPFASAGARPVALLALSRLRAPPSR